MRNILVLLLFCLCFQCVGQPVFKFSRYTTKNGLSNNDVYTIFQDNFGYLWFGTIEGFSRFDGLKFENFRHGYANNEIPSGMVTSFLQDKKNRIWIGIVGYESGLIQYDPEKESVINIGKDIGRPAFQVTNLFTLNDSSFILWTKYNGVLIYYPDKRKIDKFSFPKIQGGGGDFKDLKLIYKDKNAGVWFVDSLVTRYDLNKKQLQTFEELNELNKDNVISSIIEDLDGNIIIHYRKNQLARIRFNGNKYENEKISNIILPKGGNSINQDIIINSITVDDKNNIWIGSFNGLYYYKSNSGDIYHHISSEIDPESINDNNIHCVFKDRTGVIWVGTRLGIARFKDLSFTSYSNSNHKNSISHNKVECIFEDLKKNIWIGTSAGVDLFDIKKRHFRYILGKKSLENKVDGAPLCFAQNNNDKIWISTWLSGLLNYDIDRNKLSFFNLTNEQNRNIFSILFDNQQYLWVGTWGNGLYKVDASTNTVLEHFTTGSHEKLSSDFMTTIFEDCLKNIWVGTSKGLNRIHYGDKKSISQYLFGLENMQNPENYYISCITETSDSNLWIGTYNGIVLFDKGRNFVKRFNNFSNLPTQKICSMLSDSKNNLWIGTDQGFMKFMLDENKADFTTLIFNEDDGLPSLDFIERSSHRLFNGTMAFGTRNGFFMFHPDSMRKNLIPPSAFFTKLYINNKIVKVGQRVNDQVVLEKSLPVTSHIKLNHKNRDFSIEFIGLHFKNPDNNRYKYKLDGYQDNWQITDAFNKRVTYAGLSFGDYVFKLQVSNSSGIWMDNEKTLKISILPPWWETWWFRAIAVALLSLILFATMEIRLVVIKKQRAVLSLKVKERTKELVEKNEEIKSQSEDIKNQNKILKSNQERLKTQSDEISRMYKLLKKHNIELEEDVKSLSTAMVMQKLISFEEFKLIYPDDESCYDFLEEMKWGNGFICKKCKSTDFSNDNELKKRRCKKCNFVESLTAGTIFHKLRIPIHKAFFILILASTGRELNISKLSKQLSLRVATCWHFYNKIKAIMATKKRFKNPKGGWKELILLTPQNKSKKNA